MLRMQNTDFDELIKQYTDELTKMSMKGKTQSVYKNEEPQIANEIADEVSAAVMPVENKIADNAKDQNSSNETDDTSGIGYLTVRAFSGKEGQPEENVFVRVTFKDKNGDEHLVSSAVTNSSGETAPIALPTKPEFLSQQPTDGAEPFVAYSLESRKDGYFTIINQNVPVFDSQTSVQRLEMIPLPANFSGNTVLLYNEQSPNNL